MTSREVGQPGEDLVARHGTARRPGRPPAHAAVDVDDITVEAVGKLSAALETVEDARGHLYAFHRLSGTADQALQEAVEALRAAGHRELADEVAAVLVGRDTVDDMWSFQIVERYDAGYWSVFRDVERATREAVGLHDRHVHEARLKHREQS